MTQTTHPEELLAEYVEGTLADHDRRAVEAHLATCEACRDEAGLAGGARQMLQRLPEESVPLGVTDRVVDEAARRAPGGTPRWGRRVQAAAGFAVAAALIGAVAVTLPNLGTPGVRDDTGANAPAETGPVAPAERATDAQAALVFTVSLERVDRDFDDKGLRRLASDVAEAVRGGELKQPPDEGTPEETQQALDCIATWAGAPQDEVLVRLLRARYEGQEAYVAVYVRGPGIGEAPTKATVWVASTAGCQFLDITETNI